MEALKTKTIGKYKIEIFPDDDPQSPREDDNMGKMFCSGKYGYLGEKHNLSVEEIVSFVKDKQFISLPLFVYDHSGITMNTTGFSCPWDSSHIGYIICDKSKVRSEYGWGRITKERADKIREYLRGEVETYDQYLRGDVYGFRITDTTNDDEIDSCWGFYGDENCMTEAEGVVNCIIDNEILDSNYK